MVWLLMGLAALFALYLFLLSPRLLGKRKRRALIPRRPYAHRGLHGGRLPENSLGAFLRAAEKGYGIELDVHLTRDGRLAVMHDASLQRMCGVDRKIGGLTLSEVCSLPLLGSIERVPSLQEVLRSVAPFHTPLIIEMKSDPKAWRKLPAALEKEMRGYPGFWCVESFDPRMLRYFRRHAPQVIRGQLSYDPAKLGEGYPNFLYALGAYLLMNAVSRPDFVAYDHRTERNLSFRVLRRLFHPVLAAWTVKSKKDFERLRGRYDLVIFEGFEP